MLRNHKKHVGSPCRWLPFLGNYRLLPWSIRREEDISMEKRLHLESGRGIMEHFDTHFQVFENIFLIKDPVQAHTHLGQISDCFLASLRLPNRLSTPGWPSRRPLPSNKSGRETSRFFFFFLRGERVSVHSLLLLEVFRIVLTCVSAAFYPYLWWRFFQLTQFARYERIFIFTFEGGGGVDF